MKKVILTAIAVLGFAFANAQTGGFAKGDAFISGALTVGSTKSGDVKTSGFEIEPALKNVKKVKSFISAIRNSNNK